MEPKLNESPWKRNMLNRAFKFIKILRVEPFLFLMAFQMSLKDTSSHQLFQDKICRIWYNTTDDYCHDLQEIWEYDSFGDHYKSRILTDVAQFGNYMKIIFQFSLNSKFI